MIVKASGRTALLAAGLLLFCASPVEAQTGDVTPAASDGASAAPAVAHKRLRQASHQRYDRQKSPAIAAKADADKSDRQPVAVSAAAADSKALADIPPSVANANAQLLLAGVHLNAISAISTGNTAQALASDSAAAARTDDATLIAAADQLNDADRSLREGTQAAAPATNLQPVQAAVTMTSEASVWNQTSLIGKIFIGFGALLTMASAARMFMA